MKIEMKFNAGDTIWIKRFDFESGIFIPDKREINEYFFVIRFHPSSSE